MNNGQMLVTPAQTVPPQALPEVMASAGVGEQAGDHFAGVLDGLKQKMTSCTESAAQLPEQAEHLVEVHGFVVAAAPQQDAVSAQLESSTQTGQPTDSRMSDDLVPVPAEVSAKMVMAAYHQPINVPEVVIIPEMTAAQHSAEVTLTTPMSYSLEITSAPQQAQQDLHLSAVVNVVRDVPAGLPGKTMSTPEAALQIERHVEQQLFSPMNQESVAVPEKPVAQPSEPTQATGSEQVEVSSPLPKEVEIRTSLPPQAVPDVPKVVLNAVTESEPLEVAAGNDTQTIVTASRVPEESLAAILPQEKQPVVLPHPAAKRVFSENPIAELLEPVLAQPTVTNDSGAVAMVHQEVTSGATKITTAASPEQLHNSSVSGEYVNAAAEVTARMVMAAYQQPMSIPEVVRSQKLAVEEKIEVTPIAPQLGNFGIVPDAASLQQGNQQQKNAALADSFQKAISANQVKPVPVNVVGEQGERHVEQPRSTIIAQTSGTISEVPVAHAEELVPTKWNELHEPAVSIKLNEDGMVQSQKQPAVATQVEPVELATSGSGQADVNFEHATAMLGHQRISDVSVPTPQVAELQNVPKKLAEFLHVTSATQPAVATPVQTAVVHTAPIVLQGSEIREEKQTVFSVESVQIVNKEQAASVDYQKTAVSPKVTSESVQVSPRVATASLKVPIDSEKSQAVEPQEKAKPVAATPTQQVVDLPPVVMSEKPTTHSVEPVQSVAVQQKGAVESVQVAPPVANIPQAVSAESTMARAVVPSEKVEPVAATPTQQIVDSPPVAMSEKSVTHSAEPVQSVSVQQKIAADPVQELSLVKPVESGIVGSTVEVRNKVAQIVDVTEPQATNAVQQPVTTPLAGLQESRPVVPQVAAEFPEASITETAQQAPQAPPSQSLLQDQTQEPAVERAKVVASRQMSETLPAPEALSAHTEAAPLRTADVSRTSLSRADNLQNADKYSQKSVTSGAQPNVVLQRAAEIAELDLQLAQARPIVTKNAVESTPVTSARAMVMPEVRNGRILLGRQQLFDNNRMTGEQSPGKELGTSGSIELVSGKIIAEAVTAVAGSEEQKLKEGLVDQQPQAHNFGGVLNQEHQKLSAVAGKIPAMEAVRQEIPDQIMQQVKDRLAHHDLKPGNQQITLTLTPDTLGELKMNLNLQGQKLSVEIITENRTVRDVIAQHTETLKESLAKQNIAMESFDVTTGGKGSGGQGQQNQSAWRELVKQQQQQFWTMPRGYAARADAPTVTVPYQKPQGHAMLDIHY